MEQSPWYLEHLVSLISSAVILVLGIVIGIPASKNTKLIKDNERLKKEAEITQQKICATARKQFNARIRKVDKEQKKRDEKHADDSRFLMRMLFGIFDILEKGKANGQRAKLEDEAKMRAINTKF